MGLQRPLAAEPLRGELRRIETAAHQFVAHPQRAAARQIEIVEESLIAAVLP